MVVQRRCGGGPWVGWLCDCISVECETLECVVLSLAGEWMSQCYCGLYKAVFRLFFYFVVWLQQTLQDS